MESHLSLRTYVHITVDEEERYLHTLLETNSCPHPVNNPNEVHWLTK